jgi:iron(III) transport system ATP-binding protein
VSKSFGAAAVLDDVTLNLQVGSTLALLGPSGSGKTTLLRIIAGLEQADGGRICLGGQVLLDVAADISIAPERRGLGMVFQDWGIFPHLTVAKNVAFGLARKGDEARVGEVLSMVGLEGLALRMPGTLSGGQLQRVALARALAPRPSALLLDEPFSNLDVALRARVRSELHVLLRDAGVTTVFVTHDQEEAFVLGDQVAVLRDGRLLQCAPPRELYDAPVDAWTAAFVGDVNLIHGVGSGAAVDCVLGNLATRSACHGDVLVLVRPEDVGVIDGNDATVGLVEFYGHDSMVQLSMEGRTLRARVRGRVVERGMQVGVRYLGGPVVTYSR